MFFSAISTQVLCFKRTLTCKQISGTDKISIPEPDWDFGIKDLYQRNSFNIYPFYSGPQITRPSLRPDGGRVRDILSNKARAMRYGKKAGDFRQPKREIHGQRGEKAGTMNEKDKQ